MLTVGVKRSVTQFMSRRRTFEDDFVGTTVVRYNQLASFMHRWQPDHQRR